MQGASKGRPRKKYTKNTQDTQEDPPVDPQFCPFNTCL